MGGFENVLLNKRSQTQMTTYCVSPLIGNVQIDKSTVASRHLVGGASRGKVGMERRQLRDMGFPLEVIKMF